MTFTLNDTEKNSLKNIETALEVIYDIDELRRSYTFSPSGLGNQIVVTLSGYKERVKVFEVNKDITDYDSW